MTTGEWTIRPTQGGYALIQPDGEPSGYVYLGVEGFTKAETEAAKRNEERERLSIQRGEAAAYTITQLVDAVRQNLAGAGADAGTARRAYERGDLYAGKAAMDRLYNHLVAIGHKTDLAFEAAIRRRAANSHDSSEQS